MVSHSISIEYMEREGKRWERSVYDWVVNYCRRNKIPMQKRSFPSYQRMYEILDEDRLELTFKSEWQLRRFQQQGNKAFEYFEFV